jgi:hypothetical protein
MIDLLWSDAADKPVGVAVGSNEWKKWEKEGWVTGVRGKGMGVQ